ncbi:MAG TPA: hypothetical protein EYO61_01865 [Campylobacterales bacterium]|nr:hypothetical protein [Campylobacterales bacterium]
MNSTDSDILRKVLLLALLNRKEGDTIQDVIVELDSIQAMSIKEAKKLLKEFKRESLIVDGELSPLGVAEAEKARLFFKI